MRSRLESSSTPWTKVFGGANLTRILVFTVFLLGLGWLLLRSKKASLAVGIEPARRLLVTWTLVGVANTSVYIWWQWGRPAILLGLPVMLMAPFLMTMDALAHRIPNRSTAALAVLTFFSFIPTFLSLDLGALIRAGTAVLATVAFLGLAWAARQLGLGDVKMALSLAPALAAVSWASLGFATIISFAGAGLFAVILLVSRRTSWSARLALGPWLAIGTVIAFYLS